MALLREEISSLFLISDSWSCLYQINGLCLYTALCGVCPLWMMMYDTTKKKKKKSCQPSDLKERAFTHGGYLCLTLLQVTFYFPVHLPDKRLQLSIQFAVAHGEAVGMFRQAAALRLLLCNLLAVQCMEHGGCGGRFRLSFLPNKPKKPLRFVFLGCSCVLLPQ